MDLKDTSEIFKNYFEAFAVVVGGFWTWFTYMRLELEKITNKRAEERYKQEQELYKQAIVEIDLTAEPLKIPKDPNTYISVLVEVLNKGRQKTFMLYEKTICTVTEVTFQEDGKMAMGPFIQTSSPAVFTPAKGTSLGTFLPVGYVHKMNCFAKIKGPGLYLVDFWTALTDEEMQKRIELGEDIKNKSLQWGTQTIITIP